MKGHLYIIIFTFSTLSVLESCRGQICGCTDPHANNYNPKANVNDGSCTYDPFSISPVASFPLSGELPETSGLILWDGLVWTHNDDTDTNLYGLDPNTGKIKKQITLEGVINTDWEEIQQDRNFLYIGDFGNNAGTRTDLHILRISKQSVNSGNPLIDTIWFSFSDQKETTDEEFRQTDFDCEAFVVAKDSIYLFSKQWVSAQTTLYSMPKVPGKYIALKKE
jgi:hypothetical protein